MKIDLHLHTTFSIDGVHSPRTMVLAAKRAGLDGLAITDHNSVNGWKEAVKAGKELGVLVIKGEEVSVYKDGQPAVHVLGLFLSKAIKSKTMPEVAEEIHRQGGLAVAAHPLDRYRGRYQDLKKYLDYFDAVEVMNSHTPFFEDNEIAREFARKMKKSVTGGSDAHTKYEVGFSFTQARANSLEEFRKAIIAGKTTAHGKKANILYHAFSILSKRGLYPFKE